MVKCCFAWDQRNVWSLTRETESRGVSLEVILVVTKVQEGFRPRHYLYGLTGRIIAAGKLHFQGSRFTSQRCLIKYIFHSVSLSDSFGEVTFAGTGCFCENCGMLNAPNTFSSSIKSGSASSSITL